MEFKEPRLVLISAFRYALGRSTYMPSVIVDELIANWRYLSPGDRKQIKYDIRDAIARNRAWMECDIKSWNRILKLSD